MPRKQPNQTKEYCYEITQLLKEGSNNILLSSDIHGLLCSDSLFLGESDIKVLIIVKYQLSQFTLN